RNPPIETPIYDGTGRYMVLDGANRTTALTEMGYPHIIAQIVEPRSTHLDLKTWNHIIWGFSQTQFIKNLNAVSNFELLETQDKDRALRDLQDLDNNTLCVIQTADHKIYTGDTQEKDIATKVDLLNDIMNAYKSDGSLDRTQARDVHTFEKIHPDVTAIIIYPHFEIQEVLDLCGDGHLLPSGVTRFTVSPRALRLNYPLADLASAKSLAEKNEALSLWLKERIARKGVRYYDEPTVLFDE
ncbi:MAG: hypothetical protein N2D54_09765, partial [Chloroflexota bacterium]